MKKILSLFGLLCLAMIGNAQTQTENYVFSTTCFTADCVKNMETIQYSDGLGRPKQIINVKSSPTGKDVVTHIEYDALGRQVKNYLPVPQSGASTRNIYPKSNAIDASAYNGDKIYAEKVIENSPLGRVKQQIQEGLEWEGNPVVFDYSANASNEVLNFSTVTGTQNGANYVQSLSINGYFSANKLYKNKVTDEDGNTSSEFKNAQGQVLLIRKTVQNDSNVQGLAAPSNLENVDTYYVYNEYNQLVFVITPMASKELKKIPNQIIASPAGNSIIKELCYQYRYDNKERLVEKKLPGKGWEYLVYDKQDRLIMTQDANLGSSGQWSFTKFDQYGRPAYSGLCNPGAGNRIPNNLIPDIYRQTQQTAAEGAGNNNVFRTDGFIVDYAGIKILYTVTDSYPVYNTVTQLLSLNYYDKYPTVDDNYASGGTALPVRTDDILGQKTLSDDAVNNKISTKGLPVASYVNIVGGSQWTKTFLWYDELGRSIGTHTINHLGGSTIAYSLLDFTGTPDKTETWHKRTDSETPIHIVENFEYDDQKRLLKHYHEVVGKTPKELLAENHYNEKDLQDWKKVGGTGVNPLQTVDYDYNIRSWLTGINSADISISSPYTLNNGKLFGYKIKYNNPDTPSLGAAKYNGNISEIDWIDKDSSLKRYGYQYDKLNRLLVGNYQDPGNAEPESHINDELLTYDLNGNIKTLVRKSKHAKFNTPIFVDDLSYQYNGNKVTNITDASINKSGYEGGGQTIQYDNNGNMTAMADKGISAIAYNFMNLPQQVNQNTNTTNYYYRADGSKIKKVFTLVNASGTKIINTEYLDGFQYSTPNTDPLRKALEEQDDATTKASTAGEAEAFVPDTERKIVVANPGGSLTDNMVLSFFPTAEGYYDYENLRYIYQYKDHLGNVRVSYVKNGNDLEIRDRNDYYPFGMSFLKGNLPAVFDPMAIPYNYKYNGKELQETGMYDYGARFYMQDIGRFGIIDQRSENTKESYSYVWNNPIRFLDPTGMEGEEASGGSGGSENGSQVTTGCCPDEIAPNKPGGINNPRVIEQVNLTAPGKPIENKSAGVSVDNSYQVQLAGVNSKAAFAQAYPIYQAIMWAIGAYASYKVAEKATDVILNPPTYRTMGDEDDVTGEIDIEGVVIPGLKKIDDSGIKVPVDVLGGLRVDFARKKGSDSWGDEAEHTRGTRPSTKKKHEKGQGRKGRDKGGEKKDRDPKKMPYRRK